jgi:hypothetical protein
MRRSLALILALAALWSGCRTDEVELSYRYETGNSLTYLVNARASASWAIGGRGAGSYETTMEVTETIDSVDDGAVVSVVMDPIDVKENGLPAPGSEKRTFSLRIGPNGQLLEVLEVDGVPASALDQEQLGLIATYRPPLPLEPVGLGDTWRSEQEVKLPSAFQQVVTIGELEGFSVDDTGEVASISYEGKGPLAWTTSLAQGDAELTGRISSTSSAQVDIGRGYLREASSSMAGDFDVRALPVSGEAPRSGTLHLELQLDLRLRFPEH